MQKSLLTKPSGCVFSSQFWFAFTQYQFELQKKKKPSSATLPAQQQMKEL